MTRKKENLVLRAGVIESIRTFFSEHDFLEVETPCRIPAPAPEENIDAIETEGWFLHTSPELCMKRLLAAGYPKIFQICKCFRKNERGRKHLPELTMLEWYGTDINYLDMMKQCEEMIRFVASKTGFGNLLKYQGNRIDLESSWGRMTVAESFEKYGSMKMDEAIEKGKFDEIMGFDIEPNLGMKKPVFLYDYPASCGALAKLKSADLSLAERFELYISGMELCNAFTELTDHKEQRERFKLEMENRKRTGKTVYPMPEKFLDSLIKMPNASGNALGIDRLVMLIADTAKIDDVVAFLPEEL
ncbi:MAG: EF-P lysine aminoacylase GenX [Desulfobacterales bacterium]|nr:EF-P lysine aminoacylase GenX [Desulfobacterales bacterium]